jgi:hypothetical protein
MAIAIGATLDGASIDAQAESVDDLQAQIDRLDAQMTELARQQQAVASKRVDDAVTAGATRGSFRLPGSKTSVTLGGYVKLDAVFSNPSAGVGSTADLFLQPGAIPVGPDAGDNEHAQVKLGARETRLFARTATPTAWGDLVTYVEGDFYGADGNESVSNSHGLRLRHAYGSLGGFLAGQTWTNFMDVPSLPETLDFGGPVGQVFARQAQVRWTQPFAPAGPLAGGRWSVALENPESVITVPGGASFRADDDRTPDATGQVVFDTSRGRFALSGLLRQVRADARTPAVVDEHIAAAVNITGVVPTFGKDDVRFLVSAGNGIGRYSNGFFPDAILGADGALRLPRQWGWYGAMRHVWREGLRSSLVLSGAGARNPLGTPGTTNQGTRSAHVNLIWTPVPNADLGIELIHATRTTEDGLEGRLNRLQASAKYTF